MNMGLMMLALWLVNYLNHVLPVAWWWAHQFGGLLLFVAIVVPLGMAGHFGARAIKRYITFPRTGYVAHPKARRSSLAVILSLSFVLSIGVIVLVVFATTGPASLILNLGWIAVMTATYAVFVLRLSREHPWKWGLVLFLAAGLSGITLGTGGSLSGFVRPAMALAGFTWMASGALTLVLYCRRSQPATR